MPVTLCHTTGQSRNSESPLAAILSDKEPQPLARYSRKAPAELERIVSKALRKEREQRYQTTKDILLDLQSLKQQLEFEAKLERETGSVGEVPTEMDHSKMDHSKMGHGAHAGHSNSGVASIFLPYEFPADGDYRIWVQFKIDGQVMTAVFDATVAAN